MNRLMEHRWNVWNNFVQHRSHNGSESSLCLGTNDRGEKCLQDLDWENCKRKTLRIPVIRSGKTGICLKDVGWEVVDWRNVAEGWNKCRVNVNRAMKTVAIRWGPYLTG
jgi:hypothetical protein